MVMLEDHEAILNPYQCALYYVQSPSTLSITNSATNIYTTCNHNIPPNTPIHNVEDQEALRLTLSRYSSSHGSNNSFLHEKKLLYNLQTQGLLTNGDDHVVIDHMVSEKHGLTIHDFIDKDDHDDSSDDDDEDDVDDLFYGRVGLVFVLWWWWRRYFSYHSSSSYGWISLQICWRLFFSLCVALLVFYLVAKPPPPVFSVKMGGVPQFGLGEGVDATGIPTNIFTFNCTIDVVIHNFSKLFGLHVSPPFIHLSFGRLPFATSHGPKVYAKSYESTLLQLYIGTKNKPMYGAGRGMQDMLESGQGLPLTVQVNMRSSFRVVGKLIKPKFHHQAICHVFLNKSYDNKHTTQSFNSTCLVTS